MESEPIIEVPIEPVKHEWYVYYSKSGIIKEIHREKIVSNLDYVITLDQEAGKIISGHVNKNHYCVNYNSENDSIEFMHRKYAGNLQPLESSLYQIPLQTEAIPDPDIGVRLYPNDNVLTIDIGKSCKNRLTWGIHVYDIKNPQGSFLNIYITKKDNPDYLILQVKVDPIELITHERILVELPTSVLRYVNYNDISIWTTRIFDVYTYRLIETYVDIDPKDNRRIKITEDSNDCHITFSRTNEGNIYVKGTKDILQLSPEKVLQFYVVDATITRDVESRYLFTLDISLNDIIAGIDMGFKYSIPEKFRVLHKHKLKIGTTV